MSEYWKSTPKYWCKHCKTYVRDTKLEKTNHEATPKHQGNLKRFLRDLHRGHEKDEKDKERAKAEVARLNGMASASSASSIATGSGFGKGPSPSLPKPQATAAQRKQQLAQLAEMGIDIPDEFRGDLAMAGEWQVTSERVVEREGEKKPDALALGIRKRMVEEDEAEAALAAKKIRWGSSHRTHPTEDEDGDLDALLSQVTRKGKEAASKTKVEDEIKSENKTDIKQEIKEELGENEGVGAVPDLPLNDDRIGLKREPSDGEGAVSAAIPMLDDSVKPEGEEGAVPGVVFKKRKAKNIRQK